MNFVRKLFAFLIVFFCYLIFANISISSQIFDYETEAFVNKLLNNIKEVNKYAKKKRH